MISKTRKSAAVSAIGAFLALSGGNAEPSGLFGTESLNGHFVVSGDGGFVAQTPFAENPLRLSVAIVGRLAFDGNGLAEGHWTISFHHAAVPFGVQSRFEVTGSYEVAADGQSFMEFEEFRIDPVTGNDGIADGIVGFECYIVKRLQEARCILSSLVSLRQGQDPVPEPVTLSTILERQN